MDKAPKVLDALANRRARRAFASTPVPPDALATLWEAVRLAPSHGNSQPVRLLVAESPAARDGVFQALSRGNQNWAGAAPVLVAVAALPGQDLPYENSDGTVRPLWAFHTGIATANLLAQATALGLLAHPMSGFDEPGVRAAFAAPEGLRVLTVVAVGYSGSAESLPEDLQRRETSAQKRLPLESIVGVDRWHDGMAISARDEQSASPREKR